MRKLIRSLRSVKEAIQSTELDIHHPVTGQILYVLNPFLLNQHNAWHNLEAIKDMHTLKHIIFLDVQQETNSIKLMELAMDLQEVEFHLQELWGFPRDARFHKFWDYPKCTCPKVDNEDNYPTGFYIIDKECPLHGTDSTSGSGNT